MIRRGRAIAGSALLAAGLIAATPFGAAAELQPESGLLSGSLTFALTQPTGADESAEGLGFGAGYERMMPGSDWALGLDLCFARFTADTAEESRRYTTWPITVTLRYLLDRHGWAPYAGGGLGVHFSQIKTTRLGSSDRQSDNGFALAGALGLLWFVGEDFALDIGYTPTLTDSDFVDGNLVHLARIALVFQTD